MIIDWYTIIFQIINFMILVFLLRRFLYKPVIRAMDEREQKIVQREENAAAKKKEAEQEAQNYRRKKEELEERSEEVIEGAHTAAEKEKRELLDEARREVDETRRRWQEAFEREKDTFISELRRRIGQQACTVARRCLEDLADSRLEELTWRYFLEKLSRLPDQERSELKHALADDGQKLVLRTAFEAPPDQLEQLKNSLRDLISDPESNLKLSAAVDPKLICGLELDAGGYRVAWNVESYLEDIEEQVLKELEQDTALGEAETGKEEVAGDGETGS